MSEENETEQVDTGRGPGGKFAPGQSGNPSGKPRGRRHNITLAMEAMLEGEHQQLTRVTLDKALEGDMVALRLCLDRLYPAKKDGPVSIDLPPVKSAADTVEASAAVLASVAAGDITPDEAGRLMALLVSHKAIVEAGELEQRIAALEERKGQ